MRILLTNDDGIHAEGLSVLERIARQLSDDVWVVAPETDQSGLAHSLTLSNPLRLRQIDERHYAVRGTPTDCVIMGVKHLMPDAPDLILSGVNSGSNMADDVTYSGTVAGAIEGTLLGIKSIALSQEYNLDGGARVLPWEVVEERAPALLKRCSMSNWQRAFSSTSIFPAAALRKSPERGLRRKASSPMASPLKSAMTDAACPIIGCAMVAARMCRRKTAMWPHSPRTSFRSRRCSST